MILKIILCILGILLLLWFRFLVCKSLQSKQWIEIKGKIVTSKIDKSSFIGSHDSIAYSLNIHYIYCINGKEYKSGTVFWGSSFLGDKFYLKGNS
jgi:branched-subunit amino acid transport protein AzlD